MDGVDELDEGERKLCQILRIQPMDYRVINRKIEQCVTKYHLMRNGQIRTGLLVDIEDNNDVERSMQFKIGLVNPQKI